MMLEPRVEASAMGKSAQSNPEPCCSIRGRRARRACVACRLSKVKCDGKERCGRCEERDLMCVLGVDRRTATYRRPFPFKNTEKVSIQEDHRPETSVSKEQVNLLNHEVHCSISGSEAAVSSTIHLHYGPSSTFVFMQQLYRFLVGDLGSKEGVIDGRSANYTAEAVSEFGYNSIFFGRSLSSNGDAATTTQPDSSSINNPELLPFDLAANFLEMYLSTLHHALPFCEHTALRKLVYTRYSTMDSQTAESRDSTLIIAVLAVGATLTDHSGWADALFLKARTNLTSWGDAVSLRSVQILMLLSEFHSIRGRPNSAVLAVGSAVHQALAIGLHHEMSGPESHQSKEFIEMDQSRVQERQSTFWALYARDRNLSLSIGRPASINDMDVNIADPTGDRNLEAAVALSRISNKVYYGVYGRKKGSVAEFCKKVQGIHDELLSFHNSLAPEIQFPLNDLDTERSRLNLTTIQMILAFDFCQTMIITLRPCLILDALQRRNTTKSGNPASVIPVECLSWLSTASQLCTKTSMNIIYLFANAIDHNPLISRMRHSRFFLEGACFVLLFDILRDPTRDVCQKSIQAVADGMHCFARLPTDRLVLISTSAITKMWQLTNELVAKYQSASSQHQSGDGPSHLASDTPDASTLSKQSLNGVAPLEGHLSVDRGLPTSLNDITIVDGNENIDFFNDNIFDLSYYLWTEDGAPMNLAW